MPVDFVAALRTEIAALESALAADPRFRKLDLVRRTLALYEDAAVATLPPEPPSRLAIPTVPVAAAALEPAPPRLCAREGCGKPIPPHKRPTARYCSVQCRDAANNQKRVRPDTGTEIRPWTPAEDDMLRRRWPSEPHGPIAVDLGRSYGACDQRALKLGIKGPRSGANIRNATPATEAPAATPAAPQAAPQSEVDRFIAAKGVTVCPPVYAETVAGGARLNPLPPLVRDETTGKWRRADAG